jgi:hypothetical protein
MRYSKETKNGIRKLLLNKNISGLSGFQQALLLLLLFIYIYLY